MSKRNNVNPDHYKTAGRDPQGQQPVHPLERQEMALARSEVEAAGAPPPPIPGTAGKEPKPPGVTKPKSR